MQQLKYFWLNLSKKILVNHKHQSSKLHTHNIITNYFPQQINQSKVANHLHKPKYSHENSEFSTTGTVPYKDFSQNAGFLQKGFFQKLMQSFLQNIKRKSIFDPLGLLAIITVTGKIIFQGKEEIGLEREVSQNLHWKIQSYLQSLVNINEVAFSRPYVENYLQCKRQLLGFCDASEHTQAVVVYLLC